jgi:glycerol-3-phosphate O-acyltransferase
MVKYLLASYPRLQMLKRNVKIIPVTINYERFLADKDLDTSGSFFTILQQLKNVPLMSLGNIFVNYGAPVDLHTYVQESQSKSLEDVSLSLTQDLYKM